MPKTSVPTSTPDASSAAPALSAEPALIEGDDAKYLSSLPTHAAAVLSAPSIEVEEQMLQVGMLASYETTPQHAHDPSTVSSSSRPRGAISVGNVSNNPSAFGYASAGDSPSCTQTTTTRSRSS